MGPSRYQNKERGIDWVCKAWFTSGEECNLSEFQVFSNELSRRERSSILYHEFVGIIAQHIAFDIVYINRVNSIDQNGTIKVVQ